MPIRRSQDHLPQDAKLIYLLRPRCGAAHLFALRLWWSPLRPVGLLCPGGLEELWFLLF